MADIANSIESRGRRAIQAIVRLRWSLIAGVILVLLAIVLEYLQALQSKSLAHTLLTTSLVPHFILELGFAFLIAFVVSWAVEARASRQHLLDLRQAREAIQQDISGARAEIASDIRSHLEAISVAESEILRTTLQAAYSVKFDPRYVNTALINCFDHRIFRQDYRLEYTIEAFPAEVARDHGVDAGQFVLVKAKMSYRVQNVGVRNEGIRITYGMPIPQGPLSEIPRVVGIRIGDDIYSPAQIEACMVKSEDNERDYAIDHMLEPSDGVDVSISAHLVKNLSDSDTFSFRDPTMRLTCRINCNVPGLRFGARGRTVSKMVAKPENVHDASAAEWVIEGCILPYNSVVLWWEKSRDNPSVAPPSQSLQRPVV